MPSSHPRRTISDPAILKLPQVWQPGLSLALLSLLALFLYRPILSAGAGPGQAPLVPWSSDALGHALKVEYLSQQLGEGVAYPDLLPDWYLGVQMLRYYPPLPYYAMVTLSAMSGGAVSAVNWFIALCALVGGLAWLPFRRWLGWLPALFGGAFFMFLPDNLRVAFAEGNLPRVMATALLPLAAYFFLRSLEESGRLRHRLALAACFSLIVLSHAMMAAIYALCFAALAGLLLLGRKTSLPQAAKAAASIPLGLMLSGWWLLPSLTGGITELNSAAMTEALAVFPFQNYLFPGLRSGNPEAVYVGAALLLLAFAALLARRLRSGYTVALTCTGLGGVLITTPFFNQFFNALPLHSLLWPLRFLGVASFLLLLALMWALPPLSRRSFWLPVVVMALLAVDGAGSLPLIHLRPAEASLLEVSEGLADSRGWRVATLDQSRLGSAPTYFFSSLARREQVFGWAYQGARTATTVAALNEALQQGQTAYLIDRLNLLGVDDVVLLRTTAGEEPVEGALIAAGFQSAYAEGRLSHYHRDGGPRALLANWDTLGIGRGAQNLAYLFPQLIVGTSTAVDDYTLEELSAYQTIVLSGFGWRDRQRAEALVQAVAARGVRVVVDLTGAPLDPIARIPRFLDVWGERLILAPEPVRVSGTQGSYDLGAFSTEEELWYTHTPQGLDATTLSFNYLGEDADVLGYRSLPAGGEIWFVGLNLPYHAAVTHDPATIDLLSELLQLEPGETSAYQVLPVGGYAADQAGYEFTYTMDTAGRALFPVARHEGAVVEVDGTPVQIHSFEKLVAFEAPAGTHTVRIGLESTPVYWLGWGASALALISTLGLLARLAGTRARVSGRGFARALAILIVLLFLAAPAQAASPIALDGEFDDWAGQAYLDDPSGDARNDVTDLLTFYFGTNPDEATSYFMVERLKGGNNRLLLRLFVDANNNGDFTEAADRMISVDYRPRNNDSRVTVEVYSGDGAYLNTVAHNADWGETSKEGGLRVEWGVSFDDLGIVPNQALRMYLESGNANRPSDRLPDGGDIQWSPADAMGYPLLALFALFGVTWLFKLRKELR